MLLTQDSEGNTNLALFLLKYADIHARDIDALVMAIRVNLRDGGEQGAVYQATALLQKF